MRGRSGSMLAFSKIDAEARDARRGVHEEAVAVSLPQIISGRGERHQRAGDTSLIGLASDAESYAMRASFKQANAQLSFKPRNLMTYGRCGQMQLRRSNGKAAAPCNRFKREQCADGWNAAHLGVNPVVR